MQTPSLGKLDSVYLSIAILNLFACHWKMNMNMPFMEWKWTLPELPPSPSGMMNDYLIKDDDL
jgi:hypothetical protein